MRTAFFILTLFVLGLFDCAYASDNGAITNLTMEQAVRIALTNNPHLAEAWARIDAAEARAKSSGKFPNPEAIVRMESAPISSHTTSQAEYVAGVSQAIPLGRRLSAARQVGEAEVRVREKELEAAALNLTKAVRSAFATAIFASEVLNLQTNLGANIQELLRITKARVDHGDATLLDLARVQAEEAQQRLEIKEANYLHRDAMHRLAAALGNFRQPIHSLAGQIEDTLQIAEIQNAMMSINSHPAIAAVENEAAAQQARVRLAKSERIPDVNLDLFYRRLDGARENAFDIGVRVPIQLFDRKPGRVREAESELRAAEARLASRRNEIGHELRERELALERALGTVTILKQDVLPKHETSLRGAEARYAAGDISLSELLQVRRDAATARLSYLEAVRSVMGSWAGVEKHPSFAN